MAYLGQRREAFKQGRGPHSCTSQAPHRGTPAHAGHGVEDKQAETRARSQATVGRHGPTLGLRSSLSPPLDWAVVEGAARVGAFEVMR